jgi:hypothetical protein
MPNFLKSSQNIYNYVQIESPSYPHQPLLKPQNTCNKQYFEHVYVGEKVTELPKKSSLLWAPSSFEKITKSLQE